MVLEVIKEYCKHSQFHGLRFIAQKERHWFERLFWIVCICLSWCGCFFVILSSLDAFKNHSLSFATDTTFIEWNTSLFAVSVCEDNNMERVFDIAEQIYGMDHNFNLDEVLKEISFFKGNSYYIKEFCFNDDLDCPKDGFKELTAMVRSPCNETFELCEWNDVEFNCCEYFQLLETELGPCYSLNSIQVKKPKSLPLISNKMTGPGTLYLELWIPSNVYVHSPEDVPNMNTVATEFLSAQNALQKKRLYSITEIVNERQVKDVEVSQRRCRYPEENYLKSYPYYSYTACVVECRAKEQLRVCNCTSHLTPGAKDELICDLEGLHCLNENFPHYSVIINPWTQRQGLVCPCLPGCAEPEYDLVEQEEYGIDDSVAIVELALDRLPTIRLKRSVVRGQLDLVVSMGGTAGLFVGASLLSFVEVLYFFTIRVYYSYRAKKEKNKMKKDGMSMGQSNSNLPPSRLGNKNIKKSYPGMIPSQKQQYPMKYFNEVHHGYGNNNYFNQYSNNVGNSAFYM